ncbi:hypothetical protein OPQ81_008073 [Rhizoctonia solani]|nr:hypothetical protein OPQ81_008073 [Rhizoctonia solani]
MLENTRPHGRKRSHDDMIAEEKESQESPAQDADTRPADRQLVKSVVDNMFDSEWELDALGPDGQMKKYEGPMPGDSEIVPDIQVFTRRPWPATKVAALPRTSPSKQSICYIVKGQPRRGKFDVKAAEELGVQRWDFGKLTSGKTVKGKDDIDVTPDMVLGATILGRGFAFIDLPDESYINELLARPEWSDDSLMETIDIMYWNLGRDVQHDERVQDFMQKRGGKTHTIFSPDINPNGIAMHGAANSMVKMHRIDPDRFSLPVFDNKAKGPIAAPLQDDEILQPMDLMQPVQMMDPKVIEMADKARAMVEDPALLAEIEAAEKDIPNRDLEVIALGTGSALPSKYRNVSATLIRVPGYGSPLFDCGENTLGQLRRMYGHDRANEILSDLKVIWISHLHADHHLGTASVIGAWNEVTMTKKTENHSAAGPVPRLSVVAHTHMLDWLREYADVEDFGFYRLRLINIRGPPQRETIQDPITFDPTSAAARERLDAIDACRRYPKIGNSFAATKEEGGGQDQVVLMAFDMMRVKLGDFKKAELFLPALRKMLEEGGSEADEAGS